MPTTISLRIDQDLVRQAEREAKIQHRSRTRQLEYWVKLGKAISSKLDIVDAVAVSQGIKTMKLEFTQPVQSAPIDSDVIFDDLESDRAKGLIADNITSAKVYYEASLKHPGYLDRVNSVTKERQTGSFENGEFKALS